LAPLPDPVTSDTKLPAKTDVVVIGGGIVGASIALELAERGFKVVLCEKGIIAGEQSSRNWGWCRQMGRDPREIPLAKLSLKLWSKMNERTNGETGFRQCGILYLSGTSSHLAKREQWLNNFARPHGLSSRMLSSDEVIEKTPGSALPWKGAMITEDDGRAEPQKATAAIALAARAKGAKLFTNCAVRGIERTGGKISAVVTEKGTINCDTIVLAGGAWSRRFCTNAGLKLPQLTVLNSAMRTAPLETALPHSTSGDEFAIRKRLDGGYTIAQGTTSIADILPDSFRLSGAFLPALRAEVKNLNYRIGSRFIEEARLARFWNMDEVSPFEITRILDPKPSRRLLDRAYKSLVKRFPVFDNVHIEDRWGGIIDVTPDAVPVISAVNSIPGFYLATGFSGHGFGIGPGAGKLTADLITGATPCVDPHPFRYERLVDGTKFEFY
jgi:glycine/D-amino acid oxidase-like deaminating enzyme